MIIEPSLKNIIAQTELFFKNHWNESYLGAFPQWSHVHTNFRKIPNYDKQGVYAFVKGNTITYIGVGASRGANLYRGNGLSARIQKYCRYNVGETEYLAVDERLKEAGALITIGFERDTAYMAHSLETFLISKLLPVHNKVKTGM